MRSKNPWTVVWGDYEGKLFLVKKGGSADAPLTKPVFATRVTFKPGGAPFLTDHASFSDLNVGMVENFWELFEALQKERFGADVFQYGSGKTLWEKVNKVCKGGSAIAYFNDLGYLSSSKGKLIKYLEQLGEGERPDWVEFRASCGKNKQQLQTALVMINGELDLNLAVLASTEEDYNACREAYEVATDKKRKAPSKSRPGAKLPKTGSVDEEEETQTIQAVSDQSEGEGEDEDDEEEEGGEEEEEEGGEEEDDGTEASATASTAPAIDKVEAAKQDLYVLTDGPEKAHLTKELQDCEEGLARTCATIGAAAAKEQEEREQGQKLEEHKKQIDRALAAMKKQKTVRRKGCDNVDVNNEKRNVVVNTVQIFHDHVDPVNKLSLGYGAKDGDTTLNKEKEIRYKGSRETCGWPDVSGGAVLRKNGAPDVRIIVCEEDKGACDASKRDKAHGQSSFSKAAIEVNADAMRGDGAEFDLKLFCFVKYAEEPPQAVLEYHAKNTHAAILWATMSVEEQMKHYGPLAKLLADEGTTSINNKDLFLARKTSEQL